MQTVHSSRRQRIGAAFRHTNTWLIIATLALAGWTIDALRMALGMHGTEWPGPATVISHFWYIVPIAVALLVLRRLRPTTKLLGLALYDEAGRMIHRQGHIDPDELTAIALRLATPGPNQHGLHGVQLPSGNYIYFVRQGGCTIILCFSGPASVREAENYVQRLHEKTPAFDLLAELQPPVAALATELLASPVKRSVLIFFREHDHLAIGRDDLAYRLQIDPAEVAAALDQLVARGMIARQTACDLTFYQLQRTPEVVALLDAVFAWRERWQTQAHRLEQMID